MKKVGLTALAVVVSLGCAQAQQKDRATTGTSTGQQNALHMKAAEVLGHQQQIEASIRENTTDKIQKHAEATLRAAEQTMKAAEQGNRQDVAQQAKAVVETARQMVEIGKEGTYAENSAVLQKLGEQAKALNASVSKEGQTTGTLAAASGGNKALNNTICPISNVSVDAMGEPVTVAHNGQTVTLCCEACRDKFMKDPDANLEKARQSSKTQ